MITLPRGSDQVLAASLDWESASSSPALLLKIGGEDHSERIPDGDWSQDGMALSMEATYAGHLPRRLYGAPVELSVLVEGAEVPCLRGLVSLPEPNDDRATTKLVAASAGSLADKYPLGERVSYAGVRPDYAVRDALRRLPYRPGVVRVDPVAGPPLQFVPGSEDGPFEPEQTVADVLSKVAEKAAYSYRDDAWGGHAATVGGGIASTEEPSLRLDSGGLLSWKEPALALGQYARVVVFRRNQDGSPAFPDAEAAVTYPGLDYPPPAGLSLPVPWAADQAGAQAFAYQKAAELGRGLYKSEPVLAFFPLLEAGDRFLVHSVVEEDEGGFFERGWLHHVDSFEQLWGRGFETKATCSATLYEEQFVKAPTLVLAATTGVSRVYGPAWGRDLSGLFWDLDRAPAWFGGDAFGNWSDDALDPPGTTGRDSNGRFVEVG